MLVRQAHHRSFEKRLADDAQACRVRAEQGDAFSQYTLAMMYHHGKGLPQDYGEAFRWYRKAADQGNVKAQYALGYMNYIGEGVPQNFIEAFNWYHKAADQGYAKAQYALGLSFYNGRGGPQDFVESARWYRKAADQGTAQAQYCLGYMYYYGQGVPQDRTEANRLFHKAADQGDQDAQRFLGTGLTIGRKLELSIQLFGGIFLLLGSLVAKGERWFRQRRLALWAGILCILTAGLSWYGYTQYMIRCLLCGVNWFTVLKWSLDAVVLAMLIYIVRPGAIRRPTSCSIS
jgi:TPR repeat protein